MERFKYYPHEYLNLDLMEGFEKPTGVLEILELKDLFYVLP